METIYTGPEPDLTKSVEVLAFLLVPVSAFYNLGDSIETVNAVTEMIESAKRTALQRWYAQYALHASV